MGVFGLVLVLAMAFSPVEGYNWDFPWYVWLLVILLAFADVSSHTIRKHK